MNAISKIKDGLKNEDNLKKMGVVGWVLMFPVIQTFKS